MHLSELQIAKIFNQIKNNEKGYVLRTAALAFWKNMGNIATWCMIVWSLLSVYLDLPHIINANNQLEVSRIVVLTLILSWIEFAVFWYVFFIFRIVAEDLIYKK